MNNDNSILFFKIWRNIVIKNKILNICSSDKEIYEKLLIECQKLTLVFSAVTLLNYKYRDYLTNISISNKSHLYDVIINNTTMAEDNTKNLNLKYKIHFGNPDLLHTKIKRKTIPSNVRHLRIIDDMKLKCGSIPPSVKSITLVKQVPFTIPTWIPSTLIQLDFGEGLNYKILKEDFPDDSKLEILKLPNNYLFHPISNDVYPKSVKEIHFGENYNTFFKSNSFPINVEKVYLGSLYSRPLETDGGSIFNVQIKRGEPVLPLSLVYLEFSIDSIFNEIIKPIQLNYLSNLRELVFGNTFNRDIEIGTFPDNLQVLRFGKCFNKPLNGVLPKNLKILEFAPDSLFDQQLDETIMLPNTLEILKMGNQFDQTFNFPLPDSLKELYLGDDYNQILNLNPTFSKLEILMLGDSFNQPINHILIGLKSLQKVVFGINFNRPLSKLLFTKDIIRFKYGTLFNQDNINPSEIFYIFIYPIYNNKVYS